MIYCVEDDRGIRELIVYSLNNTGFSALGFESGRAMLSAALKEKPELVLLDIMLPGEDGISILKTIKTSSVLKSIPVIMVTARGTEYDKVIGLDSGADDYIAKPFGMMELISRIKAVLRRLNPPQADVLAFGHVKLDKKQHEVTVNGAAIQLTLKEYELLKTLMENSGLVMTRDNLLENVWGYGFDGETRTVDVHIRTLRQKLGEGGDIIDTIRGVGYRIKNV